MSKWKITAYVDGRRTETIIAAWTTEDARKLFAAQYPMSKITNLYIAPAN